MKYGLFFIASIILINSVAASSNPNIVALGNGADIDKELIYPGKIAEGPDGNIYVIDYKDYYIKVYASTGKYVRKLAGRGEGPGEAKRLTSFGFSTDNKSLFFTEFLTGHPWITFLDLQNHSNKTFKLNIPGMYGFTDAVMLPGGKFLLTMVESSFCKDMIEKKSRYFLYHIPYKLVIIDNTGSISKEIIYAKYAVSISMITDGADITIPFRPEFLWINTKDKIIFADGLSTKLKVMDYTGKLTAEIVTPLPEPGKVSGKDIETWRNNIKALPSYKEKTGAFSRSSKVIDFYNESVYEKKPNLTILSLTPDGNILMGGTWNGETKLKTYWLIDERGKLLYKGTLNAYDIRISKRYIFFKVLDEEENTVVKFILRTKSEKEDLQNIESGIRRAD
ncbi:MAG TPA: 6-bladed beta-propeller [Candidatus Kapabacteria bacterium]|nr:6-bladed beta-propeller [Candidatus Kapabacteria bacterium]